MTNRVTAHVENKATRDCLGGRLARFAQAEENRRIDRDKCVSNALPWLASGADCVFFTDDGETMATGADMAADL